MTKSTITREQLIKKAQEQIEFCRHTKITGEGRAHVNQCAALFEIALAAMDSEPVATLDVQSRRPDGNKFALVFSSAAHKLPDDVYFLYRHAQPVPVVSADLLHTAASAIEDLLEHTDPNTNYYSGVWADVPGKLRAAMFQAKSLTGNSPVIGIDLASGPDRTVEVHYVAPPGYVMVPKEPTEAMMLHNSGCQHHAWDDPDCAMRQTRRLIWSHMLAAAPQEVK
ncbi:MAG: hypothetical protein E6Z14_25840 [Klebsiella pneumoniae]|nr:hypothetical protein [Klebsiella pneumoniae]UMJ83395.1 hypothetical protein JJ436_09375 [Klebsiella pneumoniae]HBR2684387.1 hypothetical protein [Klebsiella pneumoniae]HBS7356624.1 hypothetical protein [Klebsiella pneumoniae]